ncbi:SdpA family antimicrobial peptide system protein [Streptomyces sp. NBC_00354]|uniref:SdpA family antimicrobial peptide system protein n=1 Tax=Streptomyces sp. NBC_00354 TaxID=2975723 RepID=UPI003FA75FFE
MFPGYVRGGRPGLHQGRSARGQAEGALVPVGVISCVPACLLSWLCAWVRCRCFRPAGSLFSLAPHSNLFGLERSQRAQGPEVAYLEAAVPNWIECSGTLERCLPRAAETPAAKLENRSPVQTLCGDSFITQESVVPWSYRDLVKYDRRITKIAHLDVSCP